MAKIVAVSGTDQPSPTVGVPLLVWAFVLGVGGWIFWSVVRTEKGGR